jgi:RNA polymerase sigma factor (TIGR02999 family)
MGQVSEHDVTRLLEALQRGDDGALDALFPLVYDELRVVAHRQRQHWQGDYTLDTTALVHEAYLKLLDQSRASWESRAHFLATAARAMRHILVNYARDRVAQKRGGNQPVFSLEELGDRLEGQAALSDDNADLLIALDAALENLERTNERQSRIVECRFFGGMSIEETAEALGISTATVSRGWALAQVRLYQDVRRELQS